MAGSLNPEASGASDDTGEVAYRPTGTGTANDGRKVRGVVLVDTTGNAYAASGGGGGGGAATIADGADVAQGTTTDAASASTVIGLLKNLKAALAGTLTVSGTVTSNAGTGTLATSVADGQNVAIGTTTDASSASTTIGLLKNIKAALAGTLTVSGAVTNSNLDVALSTRLKPADTLAAVTTVGAVTAITNALPAGGNTIGAVTNTNLDVALSTRLKPADTLTAVTTVAAVTAITNTVAVGQKAQTTVTTTMQNAVAANGNGTVVTTDGYNGALLIFISNSTGTATLTIEGSLDSSFTTAQDVMTLGVYKLTDSGGSTNTSRAIVSGAIAVAASTSYLYAVADSFPYIRARVSGAASLAALTVKSYAVPV